MARGESGRIVLEVDPDLKGELYVELARRGLTLKAWFVGEAKRFVLLDHASPHSIAEPPPPKYGLRKHAGEVDGEDQ